MSHGAGERPLPVDERGPTVAVEIEARPRIGAIEGLRGVAVALVFAVHFAGSFAIAYRGFDPGQVTDALALPAAQLVWYWLFHSHHGVYVFFAISGFVISRSFADKRTLADFCTYLGHRIVRIYPAFLVSLGLGVLLAMRNEGASAFDVNRLLQNLVFLNGAFSLDVAPYNFVTWSLFFEFIFYLAFPLLYLVAARSRRARNLAPWLWLAFVAALAFAGYREWFLLLTFLFGAVAGLQTADRLQQLADRMPDGGLIALYAAITTLACLFVPLPRHTASGFIWPAATPWYVGSLSVAVTLILVKASFGRGVLHRVLASRPLLALGRISFSFFLLHAIVLQLGYALAAPFVDGTLAGALVLAAATFAATYVLATVLYVVAEKPYYRFRRHALATSPEQRLAC